MSLEFAGAYFVAVLLFSITPGPGVFALLARALAGGSRSCWGLALGMIVGDLAYLLLVLAGLAYVALQYGLVLELIRWFGGAYLLYLAYLMWRAPINLAPAVDAMPGKRASFAQGALISATNPKVMLFYLAFVPSFVDLSAFTPGQAAAVALINSLALLCGLALIIVGAGRLRHWLREGRAVKALNYSTAGLMALAGGWILARG